MQIINSTKAASEMTAAQTGGDNQPQKSKVKNRQRISKNVFVTLMVALPVLHFCVFYLYANFSSIMLAFQRLDKYGNYYFSMENFGQVFDSFASDSGMVRQAVKNSLIFFCWNTFVILPLSMFFSFFFYKRIALKSFFRFMFFVPTIISGVAVTTMYKFMLGNEGPVGVLWKLVFDLKVAPPFFSTEEYAMGTLLIYMLLTGFSGDILMIGGAMSRIPEETVEAAILDGIGMWKELFSITLPMIWPTLSTIIVTTAASVLCSSGPVLLLTAGAGSTYDISYYIYDKVQIQGQYGVPAALGLVLTVITFPIVMFTRWGVNKIYNDVEF
ncbi:MAG: sugar ABC transporter permease [Clostridia bacterium]|nr:sugar ABC transporter permease [Clostridia bacterium]